MSQSIAKIAAASKAKKEGAAGMLPPGMLPPGLDGLEEQPGVGAGAAPTALGEAQGPGGTSDPFAGQKFSLTPVQQKGRFSGKTKTRAEGIYGSEEERSKTKR